MNVRSVAVPFSPYRLSYPGNIIAAVINQPLLSPGYEHTEVHRHAHARTHRNTHDRMVGSRQTQVRCGGKKEIQISLPHCSTKRRWVFGLFRTCSDIGAFLSLSPFYFQILFSSLLPLFFLVVTVGSQSPEKKKHKKKKERKKKLNQSEKKEGG